MARHTVGAEEPALGTGLDCKAHCAELTQGSPVLRARVRCLAIFTSPQGPVLMPTLRMREMRPVYLPQVTEPAVEVSPDPHLGGRTTIHSLETAEGLRFSISSAWMGGRTETWGAL